MSDDPNQPPKKAVVYDASRLLSHKPPSSTSSSSSTTPNTSSTSSTTTISGNIGSSSTTTTTTGGGRLPSILAPRNIEKPTQHFKSSSGMTFTPNLKPKQIKTEDSTKTDGIDLDVFMGQASNQTGKRKPPYNNTKPNTKAIMNKNTFNLVTGIVPMPSSSFMELGGLDSTQSSSSSGANLKASGFGGDEDDDDDDEMMKDLLKERKNLFSGVKQAPIVLPFNEEAYLRAEAQRQATTDRQATEDSIDEVQQNLFKNNIDSLMSEDKLFFIQLPSKIPYMDAAERKRQQAQEKKVVSTSVDDAENIWTQPFENTLDKVPNGLIGEMVVYKSGKVKLKLGDVLLDVFPGSEFSFPEHVACVDATDKEKGQCHILGNIAKRFSCVPDVDYLLRKEGSNN